jgi:hypothetical protein
MIETLTEKDILNTMFSLLPKKETKAILDKKLITLNKGK